jgi:hypothetical protein
MKYLGLLFIGILVPLICIIIAGIMAIKGIDGWGWFIFASVVTARGFSYKHEDKKDGEG